MSNQFDVLEHSALEQRGEQDLGVRYHVDGGPCSITGADMVLFPMFVKIEEKMCVVVGGGRIALSKITGLLRAGAQVVVVSPKAIPGIQAHAEHGKLVWRARKFRSSDLKGAFLVVAASNSRAANKAVYRVCANMGILCNAVDEPQHCDFFYPAVVSRGALQIAISTGGRSPALAHRLRCELEQQFGREYDPWVEHVGKLRRKILDRHMAPQRRRKLLQRIASREAFNEFMRCSAPAPHAAKS